MAKNIMNTSDKSNFILNMTEEQYSKAASLSLIVACLSVSLFTIPPEVTKDMTYSSSTFGLAFAGVFCMIMALIALIRKFIAKSAIFPACAFGAMIGWGAVSMLDSYDINVGFYGFPQRGEGLLAIIFYISFFITAASLKRQKALKTVVDGIILAGLVNSVFALLQIFVRKFEDFRPIAYRLHFAASGLSQSAIFLAMVLTLALVAASVTFVLECTKKRRIFCVISSCIIAFTMICTYSLVSLVGIALAVIFATAAAFMRKSPKKTILLIAAPLASAALAVGLSFTDIAAFNKDYKLYDGYSIWVVEHERTSACSYYDQRAIDITSTYDVYYNLNQKTIDIIKEMPMTGTGPEQLIYPQLYTITDSETGEEVKSVEDIIAANNGTFDKVYNEYLNTAATRGIPSLIALLCVIIAVLCAGYKNAKLAVSPENAVLFFVTLGGALIFLIGCSNIAFTPIFWTAAGASCVCLEKNKPAEKKKSVS